MMCLKYSAMHKKYNFISNTPVYQTAVQTIYSTSVRYNGEVVA